ncbi:MAG: PD-(D/E)XK motif protein [Muricomes sp.]
MNTVESIFSSIQTMQVPQNEQYSLSKIELSEAGVYYGKNSDGHSVFAMVSQNTQLRASVQKTKKLVFWFNAICDIVADGAHSETTMNVLTCLSNDENEILAFVRLTLAFIEGAEEQSPRRLYELFTALTNLFASAHKANQVELQGFYGELYAIKYFYQLGINLSDYWQKKEKMKFDFSISAQKKVEIKSTIKDVRIHHFRHEQLLSDLYDICIVSIMLRTDEQGLSLLDLVRYVQEIAANNFDTLIYIEDFVKNFDEAELNNIKYDTKYTDRTLHIYKATAIPRFEQEQPHGVSKTEYDSDLTNSDPMSTTDFADWIQ